MNFRDWIMVVGAAVFAFIILGYWVEQYFFARRREYNLMICSMEQQMEKLRKIVEQYPTIKFKRGDRFRVITARFELEIGDEGEILTLPDICEDGEKWYFIALDKKLGLGSYANEDWMEKIE